MNDRRVSGARPPARSFAARLLSGCGATRGGAQPRHSRTAVTELDDARMTQTAPPPGSVAGRRPSTTPLVTGLDHVALRCSDLRAFIDLYSDVFDASVEFREATPAFEHAMVRVGGHILHAVAQPDSPFARAMGPMTGRGHIDHLALAAASEEAFDEARSRLVERGASDGVVFDLGPQRSFWFTDTDGMSVEVCWTPDPSRHDFHAPVPLDRADDRPFPDNS